MKKPEESGLDTSASKPTPTTKPHLDNPVKDDTSLEKWALALNNQGQLKQAGAIYRESIDAVLHNHIDHENLSAICGMQGKFEEMIDPLKKALELTPNYAESLYNLGNAYKGKGDLDAAIASYKQAIQLKPNYPEVLYNLGNTYQDTGNPNAAIASYKKAIQINPNFPEAHNNLGTALMEQDNLTVAIDSYKKALSLKPNFPEALHNLGIPLMEQGNLNIAIDSYKKALSLKPNYPEARWSLSITMLLGGDYKSGLEEYEWRFKKKNPTLPDAHPKCSKWDGTKLAPYNQLLLVSEQGLGDTLQFIRYALALRNQGIDVSLCAQPNLHSLIQASGIDSSPLTPEQANKVSNGQWSPLLSVPHYLAVNPGNPIITEPYIKTSDELITKWEDILAGEQRPIIGINWQGNPKTETALIRGRSLPLETFAPIVQHPNASLLSLQKGSGSAQLDNCSFQDRFVRCQQQISETWDFLETAAIVANCDLVITSDTSVAHLAGGMGKTTWLLLKKVPEWRWGLKGDTSFWYPSMRLFRQKERGNWNEVLQRVSEAINKQFESQQPQTQNQKARNH